MGFFLTPAQQQLVDITLWALREHPEDWEFTRFEAKNDKLDIVVWMANSYYGLKVRGPGVGTPEEPATFTGWLQPWRRRLMCMLHQAGSHRLGQAVRRVYPTADDGGRP